MAEYYNLKHRILESTEDLAVRIHKNNTTQILCSVASMWNLNMLNLLEQKLEWHLGMGKSERSLRVQRR